MTGGCVRNREEVCVDESLLKSMTDSIVDELHPDEVILFGSHAKGTERAGSDVDFLVVVPDSEETRRHRRQLTGRLYRRLAGFAVSKDILLYTRDEVERWRGVSGHVIATGLGEGRRLYVRP
jgi:predicted nucleotidyltransferase